MEIKFIVQQEQGLEKSFALSERLFEFVCSTVANAAKQQGMIEVGQLCDPAALTENFPFATAPDDVKHAFGTLLREAINDGTIVRELYSWPVPDQDASQLLPENRTTAVLAFLHIQSQILTLRSLANYLDRYKR